MALLQYLKSATFFKQITLAVIIVAGIAFLFFNLLSFITDHGNEISVPDLSKMSVDRVEEKLDDLNLDYVIIDTLDYNPKYPKYSVVLQDPSSGSKVKKGRKIYLKLNAAGYGSVLLPDLIEKTYRQAVPTLQALGLEVGEITYKPYLGKDMVLEMKINGREVKAGTKVMKSTKIDLVLGDGKVGFEEEIDSILEIDTLQTLPENE